MCCINVHVSVTHSPSTPLHAPSHSTAPPLSSILPPLDQTVKNDFYNSKKKSGK